MILGENQRKTWRWDVIGMFRDWIMWLDLRGLVFFYLASHLPSFHAVSCVCVCFFFLTHHCQCWGIWEGLDRGEGELSNAHCHSISLASLPPQPLNGSFAHPTPQQVCPCPNPKNLWMLCCRGFANLFKLKISRWGDYPGLSGSAHCKHKDFMRAAGGARGRQKAIWREK